MAELIGNDPRTEAAVVEEGSDRLAVGVRHHPLESGALTNEPEVPLDVVPIPETTGSLLTTAPS
jgi:hypothetical protein